MPNKLKIGVSLYVRGADQSFWENGIFQNCIFLVQLLQNIDFIESACLLVEGPASDSDIKKFLAGIDVPYIHVKDGYEDLDVVIEMSASLRQDWATSFTNKGGKIIGMRVGNDYFIDSANTLYDLGCNSIFTNIKYEEIWTLPQYSSSVVDYYQIGFKAPVHIVPHLWSPYFISKAILENKHWPRYGYRPGKQKWNIGIFEPNQYPNKTYLTPLLISEYVYSKHPELINRVKLYNSLNVRNKPTFKHFRSRLQLQQDLKLETLDRAPLPYVIGLGINVVISHQIENAQNYLYYEVLWGNYPLIHNSEILRDFGYYYPGYDAKEGADQFLNSYLNHDKDLIQYSEHNSLLFKGLSPTCSRNIEAYRNRLIHALKLPA